MHPPTPVSPLALFLKSVISSVRANRVFHSLRWENHSGERFLSRFFIESQAQEVMCGATHPVYCWGHISLMGSMCFEVISIISSRDRTEAFYLKGNDEKTGEMFI